MSKRAILRIGTVLEFQNKTPASVLFKILELWLHNEFKGRKITKKIKDIYNLDSFNINFVYKFLQNCRIIIANYIRSLYILDPLAFRNSLDNITIDENLFTHLNGIPQWVIGLINLSTNEIRLEVVETRDTDTLKTIIIKHVMTGNNIYIYRYMEWI